MADCDPTTWNQPGVFKGWTKAQMDTMKAKYEASFALHALRCNLVKLKSAIETVATEENRLNYASAVERCERLTKSEPPLQQPVATIPTPIQK